MGLDDELATALVNNIAKQETTSSVNNTTFHVRSSSCHLTHPLQHQHVPMSHTVTWLLRPTTTTYQQRCPPQHIAQRRCASALPPRHPHATSHKPNPLKRPRPPKKDDNRPTNAHDRLTTTTTTRNGHNHFQTTTSDHENHQRPPAAHPTAPYL